MNISEHLSELEALRKERGMSQQELAETCGVSKTTICRALNGATEPTARLVQSIEAAVQYTPEEHPVLPAPGQSMEEYVEYLQATIIRQSDDYRRHTMQLQTHYSLLNRQNRRVILIMGISIAVLVIFLVGSSSISCTREPDGFRGKINFYDCRKYFSVFGQSVYCYFPFLGVQYRRRITTYAI